MEMNDDLAAAAGGVPPGFRFHPTEEELVGYYLKRKIDSLKIDLDVIVDVDLYRMEPWDIQGRCKLAACDDEQTEWYFFSHKDKKYPTGTRTNRATASGFWKATGRDKAVVSSKNERRVIGMRKTLVFYRGRAPNGRKTDWIVHEYRLQTSHDAPPQEEGWVVCRAFKKPSPSTHRQQYYFGTFEPFRNHNTFTGSNGNGTDHYYTFRDNITNYKHPYNTNILGGSGGGGASPSSSSIPELSSPNSLSIDNTITPPPPTAPSGAFRHLIQSSPRPPPRPLLNLTHQHYDNEWFGFTSSDRVVNLDDNIPPLSTPSSTCGGGGVVNLDHHEESSNNDSSGWKLLESLLASDDDVDDDRNNVASGEPAAAAFPLNGYQHSRRHSTGVDFSDISHFDDQSDQVGHFLAYFSEF